MTNLLKAENSALPAYNLTNHLPGAPLGEIIHESLPRVLLVDDDDNYREALKSELLEWGFHVSDFSDGREALDFLELDNHMDVVLLDWKMPTISGIEMLRQLKRRNIQLPVIFLTGLSSEGIEENALTDGAADFVDKSRGIAILALRLRLAVQGSRASGGSTFGDELVRGHLTLKPKVCTGSWRDNALDLTVTEFRIVRHLVRRIGDNVCYREIYDCVHGAGFIAGYGDDGYRTNVRSLIKRIRQKFRAVDPDFAEIENLPSFGYRWRRDSISDAR